MTLVNSSTGSSDPSDESSIRTRRSSPDSEEAVRIRGGNGKEDNKERHGGIVDGTHSGSQNAGPNVPQGSDPLTKQVPQVSFESGGVNQDSNQINQSNSGLTQDSDLGGTSGGLQDDVTDDQT